MRNLTVHDYAIMTGEDWVATPFALNCGIGPHDWYDDYLEFNPDMNEWQNYFGEEKEDFAKYVEAVSDPKHYGASFKCNDASGMRSRGNGSETIQILFDDSSASIFYFDYDDKLPSLNDYKLITSTEFNRDQYQRVLSKPVIITCDMRIFKYTAQMFCDSLFLRFDKTFGRDLQYSGIIRMDSGYDENHNIDTFSVVKCTKKLSFEMSVACLNKIRNIKNQNGGF